MIGLGKNPLYILELYYCGPTTFGGFRHRYVSENDNNNIVVGGR